MSWSSGLATRQWYPKGLIKHFIDRTDGQPETELNFNF